MYKAEFAKSFLKDLKHLSPEVQKETLLKWIPSLQKNPERGHRFTGKSLKNFHRLKFRYKRSDYRIVYEIKRQQITIILLAIGSRENFYRKLEQRF